MKIEKLRLGIVWALKMLALLACKTRHSVSKPDLGKKYLNI